VKIDIPHLINIAVDASKKSQAKYSEFPVGAALIAKNNNVFYGCNIESSSYSLTICAERVALVKALSEGTTQFHTIVIFARKAAFCPPCGACRQLLYDYAPNLQIILTDGKEYKTYNIKELLPHAFEESQLSKK
jgi:cytidine deaminase